MGERKEEGRNSSGKMMGGDIPGGTAQHISDLLYEREI